uniref:Uncharacterized protein n=1 Tax=Molossus molossus TaxID=27622 RepID=A0A7J8DTC9_MOLMO|nr:hypothetical protein HJG59_009101 [Molossus molossus]
MLAPDSEQTAMSPAQDSSAGGTLRQEELREKAAGRPSLQGIEGIAEALHRSREKEGGVHMKRPPRKPGCGSAVTGPGKPCARLAEATTGYTARLAEATTGYTARLAEATTGYTARLAEATTGYTARLAEATTGYTARLAEATTGCTARLTEDITGYTAGKRHHEVHRPGPGWQRPPRGAPPGWQRPPRGAPPGWQRPPRGAPVHYAKVTETMGPGS